MNSEALQVVEQVQPERTAQINFSPEQVQLIKNTIAKGATDDELSLFMNIAQRTGLDPFARQIFYIKRWDASAGREVGQPQTSIDGYRLIAERTGNYCPGDDATFVERDGTIISAMAFVKKFVRGEWHTISATAFFNEYAQKKKDGSLTQMWAKMPHVMIAKCAEALALRKAFPAELSGLYTREEMMQAENEPEPPPTPKPPQPPRELQRGETYTQLPPPVIEAEVIADPIADASKESNTYPTADDLPNSDPRTTEATRLRNQMNIAGINKATAKDMAAPFLFSLLGCESTAATVDQLRTANAALEKALQWSVFLNWCNGNWAGSLARKAEILGLIVAVLWVEGEGQVAHIVGTNPEQLSSAQQVKLIERLGTFLQPEFATDEAQAA